MATSTTPTAAVFDFTARVTLDPAQVAEHGLVLATQAAPALSAALADLVPGVPATVSLVATGGASSVADEV